MHSISSKMIAMGKARDDDDDEDDDEPARQELGMMGPGRPHTWDMQTERRLLRALFVNAGRTVVFCEGKYEEAWRAAVLLYRRLGEVLDKLDGSADT
jgi:hypothetical protein